MAKLTREDVERIVKEARDKGERPDLCQANLSWSDFKWTDLNRVDLFKADLEVTDLRWADLSRANLAEAGLFRADLEEVDLEGVDLRGANLIGANLTKANLIKANLSKADLSEADLSETILVNLDLRQVKGLEFINHFGPSYIDTHTLQRSQGQIPEIFLRGCGLSDWEIENAKLYNPHLTPDEFALITYEVHRLRFGNPSYYSCFISYASPDQAFAERLYTDLQNSGVRCWYAPEDMKIGDKIRHSIDQAIRLQDKLLLILSANSVQSDWVGDEVEHTLELEKERGEVVLFPLRLDDTVLHSKIGWAAKLKRDRHIGDFCGWPDDGTYQQGFKRLLNDLRAGE